MDKAGKEYWAKVWDRTGVPDAVDPNLPGLNNYVNRCFHNLFQRTLANGTAGTRRLVEVGCARSTWLPYFARELGFEIAGLDYCAEGCEQSQAILMKAGIQGEIRCADLFDPPADFREAFDAVISFGVAEHFENTAECVRAFAALVKPGGLVLTIIPNMVGWVGSLQKVADRGVFDIHVPLSREQLAKAHEDAGLAVTECQYFLPANFSVVNMERWAPRLIYRVGVRIRSAASKAFWTLDKIAPVPPNRATSPYIVAVARK